MARTKRYFKPIKLSSSYEIAVSDKSDIEQSQVIDVNVTSQY